MKKLNIGALFTNVAIAFLLAMVAFPAFGIAAFVLVAIPLLRIFVSGEIVVGAFALQKEIWVADIQENLYENNEFLSKSTDHSGYVTNKTVHLPQAGSDPDVEVDREVVPASVTKRTDTDLTYDIHEFTTTPTLVQDFEELQLSYSKRQSVLKSHYNAVSDKIAKRTAYDWAPAGALTARIIRTTGATADNTALVPGATGTRKPITLTDVMNAAKILDKDNISDKGRVLLLPVDMYYQLFPPGGSGDTGLMSASSFVMGQPIIPTGKIAMLYGFNIMVKPTVVIYSSAPEKKLPGAATATTDHNAALAWHPDYVARAEGAIKVFDGIDRPEYYGSIWSTMVVYGGRAIRTAGTGVVAIVQTT